MMFHDNVTITINFTMPIYEKVERDIEWLVELIQNHETGIVRQVCCTRDSIAEVQRRLVDAKKNIIIAYNAKSERISIGPYYARCQCVQMVVLLDNPPLLNGLKQYWQDTATPTPFQCDNCTEAEAELARFRSMPKYKIDEERRVVTFTENHPFIGSSQKSTALIGVYVIEIPCPPELETFLRAQYGSPCSF